MQRLYTEIMTNFYLLLTNFTSFSTKKLQKNDSISLGLFFGFSV